MRVNRAAGVDHATDPAVIGIVGTSYSKTVWTARLRPAGAERMGYTGVAASPSRESAPSWARGGRVSRLDRLTSGRVNSGRPDRLDLEEIAIGVEGQVAIGVAAIATERDEQQRMGRQSFPKQ